MSSKRLFLFSKILASVLIASAPSALYSQQITINNGNSTTVPPLTVTTVVGPTFNDPGAVAIDLAGNIYVADYDNHQVVRIANNGSTTAITYKVPAAGNASAACAAQGLPTTTGIPGPDGIAVDLLGNVYVADADNNVVVELPVGNLTGGGAILKTGPLCDPEGVTVSLLGDVFIADTYDNQILKVTPFGTVAKVANATYPTDVAVDLIGNVYFIDYVNTATGSSIVEVPIFSATQKTLIQGLNEPYGLTVVSQTLYVADSVNGNVYSIPLCSLVSTPYVYGGVGSLPGTTISGLDGPDGIAVNSLGDLYVLVGNGVGVSSGSYPNSLVQFNPKTVSFSAALGASQTVTLNYTLASGYSLTTPTVVPGIATGSFSLSHNGCAGVAGPATCGITYQFTPQYRGIALGGVIVDVIKNGWISSSSTILFSGVGH